METNFVVNSRISDLSSRINITRIKTGVSFNIEVSNQSLLNRELNSKIFGKFVEDEIFILLVPEVFFIVKFIVNLLIVSMF